MTPFYKTLNVAVLSLVASVAIGSESGVTIMNVRAIPAGWTNAPQGAVVHDDWSSHYGTASDLLYIKMNPPLSFPVRGVPVQGVYVLSGGILDFDRAGDNPVDQNTLSVLKGNFGTVPSMGGMFWYHVTDTNSLILTWVNAFLNRNPAFPVTFQAELWENGDFAFRYTLLGDPESYTPVLAGFRLGVLFSGFGDDEPLGDIITDIHGVQSSLLGFIIANPDGVEIRFKGPNLTPDLSIFPASIHFESFDPQEVRLRGAEGLDGTVTWMYGLLPPQEGNPVNVTPDFDEKPDTITAIFTPAYTNDTYQPITITTDVTYKDPPPETYVLEDITFQNPHMALSRSVLDHQHLGVFTGDSAKFRVTTKPFTMKNLDGLLTWGGLAQDLGKTMEVNVPFNRRNATMEPVTVSWNGVTLKANVAIRNQPTGMGEEWFLFLNSVIAGRLTVLNILDIPMTNSEAWVWAATTYPGNQINTKADAARHAYWTCLMARYGSRGFAEGLSTQHEVSAPGLANDTVMDLHNNAMGIQIAGNHTHTRRWWGRPRFQCCRDAVQKALNDGLLWYMDDPINEGQRGLLQPTNK